jgi:hypothetical protein
VRWKKSLSKHFHKNFQRKNRNKISTQISREQKISREKTEKKNFHKISTNRRKFMRRPRKKLSLEGDYWKLMLELLCLNADLFCKSKAQMSEFLLVAYRTVRYHKHTEHIPFALFRSGDARFNRHKHTEHRTTVERLRDDLIDRNVYTIMPTERKSVGRFRLNLPGIVDALTALPTYRQDQPYRADLRTLFEYFEAAWEESDFPLQKVTLPAKVSRLIVCEIEVGDSAEEKIDEQYQKLATKIRELCEVVENGLGFDDSRTTKSSKALTIKRAKHFKAYCIEQKLNAKDMLVEMIRRYDYMRFAHTKWLINKAGNSIMFPHRVRVSFLFQYHRQIVDNIMNSGGFKRGDEPGEYRLAPRFEASE